jgi:hypothetical protein
LFSAVELRKLAVKTNQDFPVFSAYRPKARGFILPARFPTSKSLIIEFEKSANFKDFCQMKS